MTELHTIPVGADHAAPCVVCYVEIPGTVPMDQSHNFTECRCQSCYAHPECWTRFVEHHETAQEPIRCPTCRSPGDILIVDVVEEENDPPPRPRFEDEDHRFILCVPVNTQMEKFGRVATGVFMTLHVAIIALLVSGVIQGVVRGDVEYPIKGASMVLSILYAYMVVSEFFDIRFNEFAFIYFHLNTLGKLLFSVFAGIRVMLTLFGLAVLVSDGQNLSLSFQIGTCLIFAEMTVYAFFLVLFGIGCLGSCC